MYPAQAQVLNDADDLRNQIIKGDCSLIPQYLDFHVKIVIVHIKIETTTEIYWALSSFFHLSTINFPNRITNNCIWYIQLLT